MSKALVVLLLGPILFAIRVDDKNLKSIQPITGIDAHFDYINFGNRLLPELRGRILLGVGVGLQVVFWCGALPACLLSAQPGDRH